MRPCDTSPRSFGSPQSWVLYRRDRVEKVSKRKGGRKKREGTGGVGAGSGERRVPPPRPPPSRLSPLPAARSRSRPPVPALPCPAVGLPCLPRRSPTVASTPRLSSVKHDGAENKAWKDPVGQVLPPCQGAGCVEREKIAISAACMPPRAGALCALRGARAGACTHRPSALAPCRLPLACCVQAHPDQQAT